MSFYLEKEFSGMRTRGIVLGSVAVCVLAVAAADAQQIVIQRAISLSTVWNQPNIQADDFHIVFSAKDLSGQQIGLSYLDPNGYHTSLPGTSRSVSVDQGLVHIEWDFPLQHVSVNDPAMFGFTLQGGVRFNSVAWYWTEAGTPVQEYGDVWQDWFKSEGQLVDSIVNRDNAPHSVMRLTGTSENPVSIANVAAMVTPPNPVPADLGPVLLGADDNIDFSWPWPDADPSYFMNYNLHDATGAIEAFFKNAAVLGPIPEPGTALVLIAGGLVFAYRRRR